MPLPPNIRTYVKEIILDEHNMFSKFTDEKYQLEKNEIVLALNAVTLKCSWDTVSEYLAIGTSILDFEGAEDKMYDAWLLVLERDLVTSKLS